MGGIVMNCVWCDQQILLQLNWQQFFKANNSPALCTECRLRLDILSGDRCEICSRPTEKRICHDCQAWRNINWQRMNTNLIEDPLDFNISVFSYNEFMKDLMATWKYRGDYVLVKAFEQAFIKAFLKHFSDIGKDAELVPIPLSQERLLERGFNQSLLLAQLLPLPIREILSRQHGEKQAKKSRIERIQADNPFIIEETINKTVILVDDIYTTGSTLRHAASLLKQNGCPNVYAFTLIRG